MPVAAVVAIHASAERMPWKKFNQLRDDGLPLVHAWRSIRSEFFAEGEPTDLN
jgi:hypothetical protein